MRRWREENGKGGEDQGWSVEGGIDMAMGG